MIRMIAIPSSLYRIIIKKLRIQIMKSNTSMREATKEDMRPSVKKKNKKWNKGTENEKRKNSGFNINQYDHHDKGGMCKTKIRLSTVLV
jgi:hypothetical protein